MARLISGLALLGALVVGLSAPAMADETEISFKLATVAPSRTPWADLLSRYKKKVAAAVGEKVKVRVFLNGIKGDEQSSVRQVFKGTLQGAGVSTGALATLVPELSVLELPFLFDDYTEADRILDGPARPIIEKLLEAKGFKLLMWSENGYRSFGSTKGFIRTPADLDKVKMRSQENEVHLMTWRALGASPVPISVGEVQSALQTGVVLGFDNTPLFTQAAGWNQQIAYFSVSRHIYQPAAVVVNKAWFDGLPADVQAALLAPAAELQDKGRKAVRALDPLLIKNFSVGDNKVEVYELTEAERDAFRQQTRGVWDEFRKSTSDDGRALLDMILAAKAKK
ncbi:MAG: TRAP transporter substrate-binding protein [Myxococcales bacterium]|nr:TRAP transporter substrate-binding protein [Myxococcales bacterium]